MLATRPNAKRIAQLLQDLEDCRQDLWLATSKDHADAARAEIHALTHSLWLAGYKAEEDA